MSDYFADPDLLNPPTERAAFSDRQAWVCAELSRLAYFRFEGNTLLDNTLAAAKDLLDDSSRLSRLQEDLRALFADIPGADRSGEAALRTILRIDKDQPVFELLDAIDVDNHQAFVCRRTIAIDGESGKGKHKGVIYVVFRGTEIGEPSDIATDLKVRMQHLPDEGVDLHSGFLAAWRALQPRVEKVLKEHPGDQVLFTGHSLGGAIAAIAARLGCADGNGACYTFGAPPIGAINVQDRLKIPVYQIINYLDIVPRLPNPTLGAALSGVLNVILVVAANFGSLSRLLMRSDWDERLAASIRSSSQYRHPGYISYLVGDGEEAHLRYNVDALDRFKWWWAMMWKRRFFGALSRLVRDHSSDIYAQKLRTHARSRL